MRGSREEESRLQRWRVMALNLDEVQLLEHSGERIQGGGIQATALEGDGTQPGLGGSLVGEDVLQ